jgi:hypothetical protein
LGPWFLVLSFSQAADLVTTWWGFRSGVPEMNPFVARLLTGGELFEYAAVKAGLVAAMVLLFHAHRSRLNKHGIQAVSIAFCLVALLNAIGILTA